MGLGKVSWKWNMVRQDPHGNWDLHFCFGLLWLGSRIEQRHRMGVHWILCCIDFFNSLDHHLLGGFWFILTYLGRWDLLFSRNDFGGLALRVNRRSVPSTLDTKCSNGISTPKRLSKYRRCDSLFRSHPCRKIFNWRSARSSDVATRTCSALTSHFYKGTLLNLTDVPLIEAEDNHAPSWKLDKRWGDE